ncbi:hypothetical protein BC828DRAFT_374424 [Blastocladiella britannica]|nr:hypothetical protein BC828DRAFT_374424 [Blastocladiella britannica]
MSAFAPPDGYVAPAWPGLYNPLHPSEAQFLYLRQDIWHYTVLWSLIFYAAAYGLAATWGFMVFVRTTPTLAWILPVVFLAVAGAVGMLTGTVFGLVLAAVYNAGNFKMSTWTPLLWSLLQMLITLINAASPMSTYL